MLLNVLRRASPQQACPSRRPPRWRRRRLAPSLGLGLLLGSAVVGAMAVRSSAELIVEPITRDNFASHHVGGPDADAGVGDWFLSNGTLCAAVSDPSHESAMTPRGGVLIDLGHCGANDDQWTLLQPMLNLSQSHVVPVTQIEAGRDAERAWLRTRAVFEGVELVTTHALSTRDPLVLDVTTRARRVAPGERLFSFGQLLLHPSSQTPVFSLLRSHPERSVGFVYPASDRRSFRSLLGALITSDLTVLVGGDAMPPISYGVERRSTRLREPDGDHALAAFSVSGTHFTFVNAFTRPLWLDARGKPPGLLQLMQLPFMDVRDDGVLESEVRIHVGERADVASITDRLYREAPLVQGRIDDPMARLHVDRASGGAATQLRPGPDGRFAFRLPAGRYRARIMAPGDRVTTRDFEIHETPATQQLAPITIGEPAWIRLPRDFVGRLVFLRADGSGPAVFGSDLLGLRIGDAVTGGALEAPFVNLAGRPIDPERVPIAPGAYRVIAVRGPEYAARSLAIEAVAGVETRLPLAPLERVAPTPGWLAADFHVHSGESFDSALPPSQQIVAFAASGAEVLVATEHDRIVDPQPVIAATELADVLVSITGVELTSSFQGGDSPYSTGHLNAFPMRPDPTAYRAGAPRLEGRRLRDALADVRALDPAPFVQLNHPRPKRDEAGDDTFFAHLGIVGEPFQPTRRLDRMPNAVLIEPSPEHGGRDLDFHGVELMNAASLLHYRRVRADWLALGLQGERIVGTANSDSHRLGRIVGLPRTYVAVADDSLEAFDPVELMASLRAGHAWGTTGPLISVRLDRSGLGELHTGPRGTLQVAVDAAPWVPLREWRAFVNGSLVHRAPIAAGETASLPLFFERDALVTIEVEGPAEGLYADALPGFVPFAFSNPIFVDADRNGRFDAPGLPMPLPRALRDPDRPD